MKLLRVIEEYDRVSEELIKEYVLNIDAATLIKVLDDLILNEDDYEDELFDPYDLTHSQIIKLKPFLSEPLNEDLENNLYELVCYEIK